MRTSNMGTSNMGTSNIERPTLNGEREWTREDLLPFCHPCAATALGEPWVEFCSRGDGTEASDRRRCDQMSASAYAQFHYNTFATDGRVLIELPRTKVRWVRERGFRDTSLPTFSRPMLNQLVTAEQSPITLMADLIRLPDLEYTFEGEFPISDWIPDQDGFDPEDYNLVPVKKLQPVPVFDTFINAHYLSKLVRCLPGLGFIFAPGAAPLDPVPFRFVGGHGLIMPLRLSEEQKKEARGE